jgi:proline utilization trans-activator
LKQLPVDGAPIQQHRSASRAEVESPDDAYDLLSRPDRQFNGNIAVHWPTEETAQSLLETFLSSLGTVQHLIDPRIFSDTVASFYDLEMTTPTNGTLWDIEFLLVMAIGELLQGTVRQDTALPGARFFKEGIGRLPGLAALRGAGVLAVEIMGLAAFYLQCADCKEDAYVYVSAPSDRAYNLAHVG